MEPSPGRLNLALLARRHRLALAGLVALCCSSVAAVSIATAENPARYPYDPACAWGRLADGHGMLLRCLEASEASALLQADVNAPPAKAAAPKTATGSKASSQPTGSAAPGVSAAPGSAAATPGAAPAAGPVTGPAATSEARLSVSLVGPAAADSGELPLADKKLGVPKDRYIECVAKNGGLSAPKGKVVLRFLVRERGRAEGVEIKSVSGMTRPAAECIADVVDRRYVGYPSAPIVGVTFPIELSQVR